MKKLFSHILSCFYFWNFKSRSFSKKRKKVAKGKKYRTPKPILAPVKKTDLIIFKDEKGTVCFSIQMEFLSYIESDTNYITIFYCKQEKMEKYLMRSSLKMVLEQNSNADLVRCHRSYIVNFNKIKMYKKDKEGGVIELSDNGMPSIPVSKSYIENVLSKFQFQ